MGRQRDQKRYPEFHATQQLREVHRAAEIYMQATGNRVVFDALQTALTEAERWKSRIPTMSVRIAGVGSQGGEIIVDLIVRKLTGPLNQNKINPW